MSESKKGFFDGYFHHSLFLFTSGNKKVKPRKLSRKMHISRDYSFLSLSSFFVDCLRLFVYAVNVNRDFYAVHSV